MKKTKLFAVLSAAMLGCCAMGGTAFAEVAEPVDYSQYQLGDINLDGEVDVDDAQYAQTIFTQMLACHDVIAKGWYTEEQIALGNVDGKYSDTCDGWLLPVDCDDVQLILRYYTDKLAQKIGQQAAEEYIVEKMLETFNNPIPREIMTEA